MNAPAATPPPSKEPDWDRLRALSEEAERLKAEGKLTNAEFERLLDEAETACNGHTEFVEALTPYDPS